MMLDAQSPTRPSGGEEELELVKLRDEARGIHDEMRQVRQWDRAKRMYQGDFYSTVEMPEWKSDSSNPKLWEIVQRFVPILTDSKPKFTPKPRDPVGDEVMARILQCGVDYEWECQEMQRKTALLAKNGLIFGNSFFYTGVYPGNGRNELYTRVLTPYEVYPDGAATSEEDLSFCWFSFEARKSDLYKLFGAQVAAEIIRDIAPSAPRTDDKFRQMPKPDIDYPLVGTVTDSEGMTFGTEIVGPQSRIKGYGQRWTVWECWITEDAICELHEEIDGEIADFRVPGPGRRCYLIGDKRIERLDTENPFRHDQIPLSRFAVDDLSSEFWAGSYIMPLADSAEEIADIDNQIRNNIRLTNNGMWSIPTTAGIKPGSVYAYPGMELVWTPHQSGAKPEWLAPPSIANYVFNHRANKQREFDDASGISDISKGNFSGSLDDVSGKAVSLLQQPTYTRMRLVQRNMEQAISRWGYQTICNLAQFWTTEDWLRILPEDLKMYVSQVGLPWEQPEYAGSEEFGIPARPYKEFLPDIKMETGSSLPEDRQGKLNSTLNLFDRGILGKTPMGTPGGPLAVDAVLSIADFPNREQFVQLAAQQDQAAAMMAAMQPQPGQTPNASGEDKALGAGPSPESESAVMGGLEGQEVESGFADQ